MRDRVKSLKLSGPNENIEWKVFPLDRILFNCVLSRVRPVVGVLLEQLIGLGGAISWQFNGPTRRTRYGNENTANSWIVSNKWHWTGAYLIFSPKNKCLFCQCECHGKQIRLWDRGSGIRIRNGNLIDGFRIFIGRSIEAQRAISPTASTSKFIH